jgi:hypothetical protein
MLCGVPKESTLFRPELELMGVVGVQIRSTCTSKDTKGKVIGLGLE